MKIRDRGEREGERELFALMFHGELFGENVGRSGFSNGPITIALYNSGAIRITSLAHITMLL